MPPLNIGCLGEAMVELRFDPTGNRAQVGFAGDTLNTAIYMARALGGAGQVSYLSAVGTDDLSDRLVRTIADEGIATDRIRRDPDRTVGLYAISTDAAGERSFAYWRGQSAARQPFGPDDALDLTLLEGVDVLLFTAISLAILSPAARSALLDWTVGFRARGGRVVFDSNYRPKLWVNPTEAKDWIARAWRVTDIALPSTDDEAAVFGDADQAAQLARLRGYGLRMGALKCGPGGPVALSGASYDQTYAPAAIVRDTTAAGDSFNAGFLAEWLQSGDEGAALMAGHRLAVQVVGVPGAIMPRAG